MSGCSPATKRSAFDALLQILYEMLGACGKMFTVLTGYGGSMYTTVDAVKNTVGSMEEERFLVVEKLRDAAETVYGGRRAE